MKITLLNTTDSGGGAALACYRLFRALHSVGEDAKMLVRDHSRSDEGVSASRSGFLSHQLNMKDFVWERLSFLPYEKDKSIRYNFSLANSGINILNNELVKNADVVHLHWFNQGFLSLNSLSQLLKSGKKVVWTLHDMWAFTGGCHYSRGCQNFESSCGNCQFVKNPGSNDLSHNIWERKKNVFSEGNISFVTCSNWLGDIARKSGLLNNADVRAIPNPIDTDTFKPDDKNRLRKELGLPEDKFLFCFIAANIHDERKGVSYTIDVLKKFSKLIDPDKAEVIIIGNTKGKLDIDEIPFKVHLPGFIREEQKIASYYAAADLFLNTSLEDNLPNTIMEAMSCGLPCVAFNIGGLGDMIRDGENGFFAPEKDTGELLNKIQELYSNPELLQKFSSSSREYVMKHFNFKTVADRYLEIYLG